MVETKQDDAVLLYDWVVIYIGNCQTLSFDTRRRHDLKFELNTGLKGHQSGSKDRKLLYRSVK
jgi:hypothetical protein